MLTEYFPAVTREGKSFPVRFRDILMLICLMISPTSGFAFHSRLADADGENPFSESFTRAYADAEKALGKSKSLEPLIHLLETFTRPEEQVELQLTIGLAYNQWGGFVDPAKAVAYMSKALAHKLPERTRLEALLWRGSSSEQMKDYESALRDYLRGLLACSYHDLSGPWPEIKGSTVPIFLNSDDPENAARIRDYNQYREAIDFERFLLQQGYYLIDGVKRIRELGGVGENVILKTLIELSPDATKREVVLRWLKSENKQPWP